MHVRTWKLHYWSHLVKYNIGASIIAYLILGAHSYNYGIKDRQTPIPIMKAAKIGLL